MANASHELRTPLAIMKTNSDVILSNPNPTKEELITTLKENTEEMDRMTTTLQVLLSFSGYENRVNKLIFSKIDLTKIISRVIQLARRQAEQKI